MQRDNGRFWWYKCVSDQASEGRAQIGKVARARIQSVKAGIYHQHPRVNEMTEIELYVKGKKIVMNKFASSIVKDIFMAVLSNLKDVHLDRITKIEVM